MSDKIYLYDTTLRDGAQGEGISFSLYDKLQITERLDEIGIDFIEGGYPLSNDKDAEYFQKVAQSPPQHAQVAAFGMTRRRGMTAEEDPGMRALLDSQAPICTVVGKTWDFHVREVLRVSLEENLAMIADSVRFLRDSGRCVMYDAEHFFDGCQANPDYALETLRRAAEAGAEWIILCDTNGGSMPETIAALTKKAREAVAPWDVRIGIHCHNDCDLAVANSIAAVQAGAQQVQGTINGFGERCGNADLISIAGVLGVKLGYQVLAEGGLRRLTELSRFVYETANMNFRNSQPFVGSSAFAHKGGMHVHAVNRVSSSYEHMNPEEVGNERRILVSELSGRSNIMALTARYNLQNNRPLMDRVLTRVVQLENEGYQFESAVASFDLLVRRCAGIFHPHFERIKYHVEVEVDPEGQLVTEATVKLNVKGVTRHEVAEGDGPVNALDAALRKALLPTYPQLADMRLVDYKVRVVNSEAGTAARIRVFIESRDGSDTWGTIGVSENIIEASWMALADAIEYKLYKDQATDLPAEPAVGVRSAS
ncbi:MAG TPA: citramalate synthase [Planctomycetaceae bacterium]|nr:citramalate synthase [Planctomycetaceae bacterium]